MKTFKWLKILNSPFMRPRVNIYIGKVAVGTPYFFPRRLVKPNAKQAEELAVEQIVAAVRFNELNAKNEYRKKVPSFVEAYADIKRGQIFVPKRIGFDFVGLGYKTKWSDTDYRFEWCPIWSFVFWKWQIALTFAGPRNNATSNYWESWLYYYYNTEGTVQERVAQCKTDFSQKCTVWSGGEKSTVNYYDVILKNKYR
jgi:hypothetical protein